MRIIDKKLRKGRVVRELYRGDYLVEYESPIGRFSLGLFEKPLYIYIYQDIMPKDSCKRIYKSDTTTGIKNRENGSIVNDQNDADKGQQNSIISKAGSAVKRMPHKIG